MDGPEASGPTATPSAGEIDKEKGTLRSRWHVWTRRGPRWLVTYGPNVDRRSVLSVSDEELGRSVPERYHHRVKVWAEGAGGKQKVDRPVPPTAA